MLRIVVDTNAVRARGKQAVGAFNYGWLQSDGQCVAIDVPIKNHDRTAPHGHATKHCPHTARLPLAVAAAAAAAAARCLGAWRLALGALRRGVINRRARGEQTHFAAGRNIEPDRCSVWSNFRGVGALSQSHMSRPLPPPPVVLGCCEENKQKYSLGKFKTVPHKREAPQSPVLGRQKSYEILEDPPRGAGRGVLQGTSFDLNKTGKQFSGGCDSGKVTSMEPQRTPWLGGHQGLRLFVRTGS
jgi:hypothetical protein